MVQRRGNTYCITIMKEGASTEQSAVVPQFNHSTGTDHLPTQQ